MVVHSASIITSPEMASVTNGHFAMTKYGPTHVLQYGLNSPISGISADPFNNCKKIIFMIPGNPGVVLFYKYFLQRLHEQLQLPVIAISHIGQIKQGVHKVKEHVTLKRQVEHKLDFIQTFIPDDVDIIFIGHSIGAYIALEVSRLLKRRERVEHQFLLFPSIERMSETPGARDLYWLTWFKCLFYPLMFILSLLRDEVLEDILEFFQTKKRRRPPCVNEALLQMVHWKVIRNVLEMAEDEMIQVQERCDDFISTNANKLTFVYCPEDRWSPLKFYRDLKRSHKTDLVILDSAIHAFVMDTNITDEVIDLLISRLDQNSNCNSPFLTLTND